VAYPINANDVVQVTIRGTLIDQTVMTTLFYRRPPGSAIINNGSVHLDNMFTNLDQPGDVLNDLTDALPDNLFDIEVDLQVIYPQRYMKQTYTPTVDVGQLASTKFTNTAAVITLRGEQANRRTVCCKHIPVNEDSVTDGRLTVVYRGILDAYVAQIQADLEPVVGVFWEPIIWGKPRAAFTKCGRDYPALPALRTDVIKVITQPTARVMRRRTVGLGI